MPSGCIAIADVSQPECCVPGFPYYEMLALVGSTLVIIGDTTGHPVQFLIAQFCRIIELLHGKHVAPLSSQSNQRITINLPHP